MSHPIPQEVEEKLQEILVFTERNNRNLWSDKISQALLSVYNSGREAEKERISQLQDQIQDEAICPASENCPMCLRGLRRKCSSAEYRGMSEALEAVSAPSSEDNP